MKNIKLYPDIQTAIGSVEETDFIASVYDVDDVLKASEKEYGQYIEIIQKGEDFIQPKTSDVQPEPEPSPVPDYDSECFYIEALEAGNVTFGIPESLSSNISMKYKLNTGEWNICEFNNNMFTYSINSDDKIYFKGENDNISTDDNNISWFYVTCKFNVGGNIMSLLNYNKSVNGYAFYGLFQNCTKLISATNLKLPVTTLAIECYSYMFHDCTLLLDAPKLPATILASGCYWGMFQGCTSLFNVPELPATTLTDCCYYNMFYGCTSLTVAPELPATTLAYCCYSNMFDGCSSLSVAPELPATTLTSGCYNGMFHDCTSLTVAPELPAITLVARCYFSMFYNCTNLKYIKMLAINDASNNDAFGSLAVGVASTGTFIRNQIARFDVDAIIPEGWTIEYATE